MHDPICELIALGYILAFATLAVVHAVKRHRRRKALRRAHNRLSDLWANPDRSTRRH